MKKQEKIEDIITGYDEFYDQFPIQETEVKKEYLTKIDVLKKNKEYRKIFQSISSVFDFIIIKVEEDKIALFLDWDFSKEIEHTMIKEIKIKENTIYIYPFNEEENQEKDLKSDEDLYMFYVDTTELIFAYTNMDNEILKPINNYLDKYALAYNNCKVVLNGDNKNHLEIDLLDDNGEVPIDTYIIAKDLFEEEILKYQPIN